MGSGDLDLHTLAGAYAMDAVADADRARFEQHLASCGACREEIRGLREATARLATAAATQPRPELRAQTLRAAAQIRQLPPAVHGDPAAREMARPPRARTRLLRRLALAGVGVLAALTVAFGAMMHGAQDQLDQARQRTHAIAMVLNAADVTMLSARVRTGGTATVVMSHRRRALVFTAEGLRALAAGRRYELWLMGPAGARPAGPLPAPRAGMVGPMVVSGLAAGDRVGLTVESSAGSPRPTAPVIMMLGLRS
jgi:anti-sigma-K factor RskA